MRKLFVPLLIILSFVGLSARQTTTITVTPATTYQTMKGWEIDGEAAEDRADYQAYRQAAVDSAAAAGINRIRMEVRSGAENPTDHWTTYKNAGFPTDGGAANLAWRAARYETINDDGNASSINASGFQWSELDSRIDNLVNPLRAKLALNGESLYVNLTYVSFYTQVTSGQAYVHSDPAEYAEFMLAAFQHLQSTYGWVPDGIEIILEPDNTTATWGDTGTLIGQVVKATGDRLAAAGFTPEFIVPSVTDASRAIPYFNAAMAVTGASSYITELAYHRYGGLASVPSIGDVPRAGGKRTAMLEWWDAGNSYFTLYDDLTNGYNSAWEQGPFVDLSNVDGIALSYINPAQPTVANFTNVTKFTSLYYKAARMNAVRIGATSTNNGFEPLAWRNADGRHSVVVKTNGGGTFNVVGLPAGTYNINYALRFTNNTGSQAPVTITAGQTLTTSIPNTGVINIIAETGGTGPPVGEALVTQAEIVYRGKFLLPGYQNLDFYVTGVMDVSGTDMLFSCKDERPGKMAVLNIPSLGGTATMKVACTALTDIELINPGDPNKKIVAQGIFAPNGTDVYVMAYSYYDGNGTQTANVFKMSRATLGSQVGPYRISELNPGITTGYLGKIPTAWRTVLGYDSLAGQCCVAIIDRSSQGPAVSGFNIADISPSATAPATLLVGYPYPNANCGFWSATGPTTYCFTAADSMGGVMWASGTKSILFFGTHGLSPTNCYGYGTLDTSLVGTAASDGTLYCYDAAGSKGPKTYPYIAQVWRYKAQDFLDVKNGLKEPYDVLPDATWNFGIGSPFANDPGIRIRSVVYDDTTRKIYITIGTEEVYVFEYLPANGVEICGDGLDNNNNGLIDENCVEICGDGIDNDGDGLIDENCDVIIDPPPPPNMSVTKTIAQCRVVVTSNPPDDTGGWGVQFKWNIYNFGARDSTPPYTRTRIFSAGTYTLLAVWTKEGETTLTTSAQTLNCS